MTARRLRPSLRGDMVCLCVFVGRAVEISQRYRLVRLASAVVLVGGRH